MAAELAKDYHRHFPKNDILLFSQCDTDPALDPVPGLRRVAINEEFVEDPMDVKELHDSLCIFDDIDNITDKKLSAAVHALRDAALELGRKSNIGVITTTHMLHGGKAKTVTAKREASAVTVFPGAGETGAITTYLKQSHGMDPKRIKDILAIPTRWLTLSCSFPKAVVSERKAFLL